MNLQVSGLWTSVGQEVGRVARRRATGQDQGLAELVGELGQEPFDATGTVHRQGMERRAARTEIEGRLTIS